jgi:hypothetical protein
MRRREQIARQGIYPPPFGVLKALQRLISTLQGTTLLASLRTIGQRAQQSRIVWTCKHSQPLFGAFPGTASALRPMSASGRGCQLQPIADLARRSTRLTWQHCPPTRRSNATSRRQATDRGCHNLPSVSECTVQSGSMSMRVPRRVVSSSCPSTAFQTAGAAQPRTPRPRSLNCPFPCGCGASARETDHRSDHDTPRPLSERHQLG